MADKTFTKNKASAGSHGQAFPAGGAPAASSSLVASRGSFRLETEHLRIVSLTSAYVSHIEALNDKHHMRYSEQRHLVHDQTSQEVYIRGANPDKVLLDLCHREAGESIGSMSCCLDWHHRVCDMGIMLIPAWTKQGLAREAWRAVMIYWLARNFKVEAGMMTTNRVMRHVCATTGMDYEGERKAHFLVDDKAVGLVMYGRAP